MLGILIVALLVVRELVVLESGVLAGRGCLHNNRSCGVSNTSTTRSRQLMHTNAELQSDLDKN